MIEHKMNISGYRGIWGQDLNPEVVSLYVRAFVKLLKEKSKKPKILIGRDGRESGPEIKKIIINELKKAKVKIIDGDILPTPTVLFSVKNHSYDAGIIITASHNPIEYNGLKFVNNKGLFITHEELEKINEYYDETFNKNIVYKSLTQADEPSGSKKFSRILLRGFRNNILVICNPNFIKEHVKQICKHVDVKTIRSKKFKVAVDMINASACVMDPYLFKKLGVKLIPLNNIPNGKFSHKPEPLPINLGEIAELVKKSGANLGFAHDPDADRLVMINENGEVVSEEYSIALGVDIILSKNPGKPIVINLSTSQMSSDIAEKYGSPCFRTKIGEPNVVEGIIHHQAIVGGEGNGGIIYPNINLARDSFVGLSLVLEFLAKHNLTLSQAIQTLPKYFMKKDKWSRTGNENYGELYGKLKNHFKDAKINEEDGLHMTLPDKSWFHIRPSNTEPIIKLFGEAQTQEKIDFLFEEVKKLIF